jgi:hypothetical protein
METSNQGVLRPGNLWGGVNEVVGTFLRLEKQAAAEGVVLWPPETVALLAAHRIDGATLLEMTDDDIREVLCLVDPVAAANFRTAVEDMRTAALRHMLGSAKPGDANSAPDLQATQNTVKPGTTLDRNDDPPPPLDDDEPLPSISDFNFVESAIRKHTTTSDEETCAIEKAALRTALRLKTFAPARVDPRLTLPLYCAAHSL